MTTYLRKFYRLVSRGGNTYNFGTQQNGSYIYRVLHGIVFQGGCLG